MPHKPKISIGKALLKVMDLALLPENTVKFSDGNLFTKLLSELSPQEAELFNFWISCDAESRAHIRCLVKSGKALRAKIY